MSSSTGSSALAHWPVLIAAIVIALAGMAWLSPVLTPLMLGVFFSALAAPAFQWLVKRKVPRWLALVILITVLAAALLGLALLIAAAIRQLSAGLQTYQTELQQHLQALLDTLRGINFDASADAVQPARQAADATNWVLQFLQTTARVVSDAVFALLVVAFLLLESGHFEARFRAGLGENHPLRLRLNSFGSSMIRYVVARTKLNLLTGLGVGVMYLVLGVDYAPVVGRAGVCVQLRALHRIDLGECAAGHSGVRRVWPGHGRHRRPRRVGHQPLDRKSRRAGRGRSGPAPVAAVRVRLVLLLGLDSGTGGRVSLHADHGDSGVSSGQLRSNALAGPGREQRCAVGSGRRATVIENGAALVTAQAIVAARKSVRPDR